MLLLLLLANRTFLYKEAAGSSPLPDWTASFVQEIRILDNFSALTNQYFRVYK